VSLDDRPEVAEPQEEVHVRGCRFCQLGLECLARAEAIPS
jgi:hypothetical protein